MIATSLAPSVQIVVSTDVRVCFCHHAISIEDDADVACGDPADPDPSDERLAVGPVSKDDVLGHAGSWFRRLMRHEVGSLGAVLVLEEGEAESRAGQARWRPCVDGHRNGQYRKNDTRPGGMGAIRRPVAGRFVATRQRSPIARRIRSGSHPSTTKRWASRARSGELRVRRTPCTPEVPRERGLPFSLSRDVS